MHTRIPLPPPTVDDLLAMAIFHERLGYYPEAYDALNRALALEEGR